MSKINLPNKLTILRIILVPILMIFMCLQEAGVEWAIYVSLAIFIIASITDYIDGHLARKFDLSTNFGKIMDPLADKLLISVVFIMFTSMGLIPSFITAIFIFRDILMDGIRMVALTDKKVIAAGIAGKIKTATQMFGAIAVFLDMIINKTNSGYGVFFKKYYSMELYELAPNILATVLVSVAVLASVLSLIEYIVKNRKDIKLA